MGGTHTCSVCVSVRVGDYPPITGQGFGTAFNGVLNNVHVSLDELGDLNLCGIPCPGYGPITISFTPNCTDDPPTTIEITVLD
jgi:hypothetical protein